MALGENFTCALRDDARVVCWGLNSYGRLGIGSETTIGNTPGQMGESLTPVDVGTDRTVTSISATDNSVCALLDDESIKCWGSNGAGKLGVGDWNNRGDNSGEMGDNLPRVPFSTGLTPVEITSGYYHVCARFDDGSMRCWGDNTYAQLGTGDTAYRGDAPGEIAALAAINLGTGRTAKRIFGNHGHESCALLDDDTLRCWGFNGDAYLGIGDSESTGDYRWGNDVSEMGDNLPVIDLGTDLTVRMLSGGYLFRCAILNPSTSVKCWGSNGSGQLGQEHTRNIMYGVVDDMMGNFLPYVRLGSIIPSTVTPTPTKTLTPTRTLSPSRTKSPTKTLSPTRTATQTFTPAP